MGLTELPESPRLRVAGPLPNGPRVAIVGTREPTEQGLCFAFELARDLASCDVAVWSGGAFGIDAAAHRGALSVGRSTACVLGAGLDHPGPASQHELFAELCERGALVSQFADDVVARRHQFLERNRVLAAAVSVLVVVECGVRSGARHAAGTARKLGRPVAMVPKAPWDRLADGSLAELALGAQAVGSAADVLRLLAPGSPQLALGFAAQRTESSARGVRGALSVRVAPAGLDADGLAVWTALNSGATHVDGVCSTSQLSAPRVQAALLCLMLQGLVIDGPRGLSLSVGRAGG